MSVPAKLLDALPEIVHRSLAGTVKWIQFSSTDIAAGTNHDHSCGMLLIFWIHVVSDDTPVATKIHIHGPCVSLLPTILENTCTVYDYISLCIFQQTTNLSVCGGFVEIQDGTVYRNYSKTLVQESRRVADPIPPRSPKIRTDCFFITILCCQLGRYHSRSLLRHVDLRQKL
jgi:hypothetical protein